MQTMFFCHQRFYFILANSSDTDEMPPHAGFVWVFTVCQRTCLSVPRMKKYVKVKSNPPFQK